MCGIVAWFGNPRSDSLDLDVLRHRGPDDQGQWRSADGCFLLGHTRLSIIDVSAAGHQPMIDEDGEIALVYNGEIYNHREIRAKITAECQRVTWQGQSDTETILRGWKLWGEGLAPMLRGMFAFAIADLRKRNLVVARDRFGIKPLYYHQSDDGIAVASEVRALLSVSGRRQMSQEGLGRFLAQGCCGRPTLIEGVRELPPATVKRFSMNGSAVGSAYWKPVISPKCQQRPAGLMETKRLLAASVQEHLESDVPVAVFLSGGVDSSIIAALAARAAGRDALQAFTVGFDERKYDESGIAAKVAARHGLKHTIVRLKEHEILDAVMAGVEAMDLPTVDGINTFIISRVVARAGYKVVLSGLGGDELFGGYPSFRDVPRLLRMKWAFGILRLFGAAHTGGTWRRLRDLPEGEAGALTMWRRRLWESKLFSDLQLDVPRFETDDKAQGVGVHGQISWAELCGYMRHMLLRDADQMAMACSLEMRVPFLDHRVVEFALACPLAWHRKHGQPKSMLLDAFADLLPEAVFRQPKKGFALPMWEWISGPLHDYVKSGVDHALERTGLDKDVVEGVFQDVFQRRRHWAAIWQLAVLGHWLRRVNLRLSYRPAGDN